MQQAAAAAVEAEQHLEQSRAHQATACERLKDCEETEQVTVSILTAYMHAYNATFRIGASATVQIVLEHTNPRNDYKAIHCTFVLQPKRRSRARAPDKTG